MPETDITAKDVDNLQDNLHELPFAMRAFSLSMRSLYNEKAPGGPEQAIVDFRKLRDDTRNDAMVYLAVVLPVTTKFISNLQKYFDYYTALDFAQWADNLSDIVADVDKYQKVTEVLVGMHKKLLVTLKKREDLAKVVVKKLEGLSAEYEGRVAQLQAAAKLKHGFAIGLLFVPFVRVIATPLLIVYGDQDLVNAVAASENAKVQEAAALLISTTLIPALGNFIKGLEEAAGFLKILSILLNQFKERGKSAEEEAKKLHYLLMQNKAKEIQSNCITFYAMLPAVESDFEAIPKEGTDLNYVDQWVEEEKKVINSKLSKTLAMKIFNAIKKLAL